MIRQFNRLTPQRQHLLRKLREPNKNVAASGEAHVDDVLALTALDLVHMNNDGHLTLTPRAISLLDDGSRATGR
jgi:hypothetical protein